MLSIPKKLADLILYILWAKYTSSKTIAVFYSGENALILGIFSGDI